MRDIAIVRQLQLDSSLQDLKEGKYTSSHFSLAFGRLVQKVASMILLKNA